MWSHTVVATLMLRRLPTIVVYIVFPDLVFFWHSWYSSWMAVQWRITPQQSWWHKGERTRQSDDTTEVRWRAAVNGDSWWWVWRGRATRRGFMGKGFYFFHFGFFFKVLKNCFFFLGPLNLLDGWDLCWSVCWRESRSLIIKHLDEFKRNVVNLSFKWQRKFSVGINIILKIQVFGH